MAALQQPSSGVPNRHTGSPGETRVLQPWGHTPGFRLQPPSLKLGSCIPEVLCQKGSLKLTHGPSSIYPSVSSVLGWILSLLAKNRILEIRETRNTQ